VTLRGTQTVVDLLPDPEAGDADRVPQAWGRCPTRKYRLIWDNIPIWYEMRNLGNLFASHGACLVADTYTTAWAWTSR